MAAAPVQPENVIIAELRMVRNISCYILVGQLILNTMPLDASRQQYVIYLLAAYYMMVILFDDIEDERHRRLRHYTAENEKVRMATSFCCSIAGLAASMGLLWIMDVPVMGEEPVKDEEISKRSGLVVGTVLIWATAFAVNFGIIGLFRFLHMIYAIIYFFFKSLRDI